MEALRSFIRKEIHDNLEGFAYDILEMETSEEVEKYIASLKTEIDATIDHVIKDAEESEERKDFASLEECIHAWQGDWFREIMMDHIPGFGGSEDDECGCGRRPENRCCGTYERGYGGRD